MSILTGLTGIVTGASWGIGEGLTKMLAAEGVRVALAARLVECHHHLSIMKGKPCLIQP